MIPAYIDSAVKSKVFGFVSSQRLVFWFASRDLKASGWLEKAEHEIARNALICEAVTAII